MLWARSAAEPTRAFAELPSTFVEPSVTITAPLAELAEAHLEAVGAGVAR